MSGEFVHYHSEQLRRVYEENSWDREQNMQPLVSIESVLATQALGMTILAQKHRSVGKFPGKQHAFAARTNLSEKSTEFFYDGTIEEYMIFTVEKADFDRWHMRVNFRQNKLESRKDNHAYFDLFEFDWLRNGNLQAWYSAMRRVSQRNLTTEELINCHPLTEPEMEELRNRMITHHEATIIENSWKAKTRIVADILDDYVE